MSTAKKKNLKVENATSNRSAFLVPLELAFAAGNYWRARRFISSIAKDEQANAIDKAYALSVMQRIKADPAVLTLGAVAIISFIMASWISVN